MYKYGVLYIIYGEIALSFLSLIINTYYTKRFVNYGFLEQLKDVSTMLITSIVLIGLGFMLIDNLENDYLKIIITIFFIGSLFMVSMYFFNRKIVLDTLEIVKSKLKRKK